MNKSSGQLAGLSEAAKSDKYRYSVFIDRQLSKRYQVACKELGVSTAGLIEDFITMKVKEYNENINKKIQKAAKKIASGS